jgi:hypothetical protein
MQSEGEDERFILTNKTKPKKIIKRRKIPENEKKFVC